MKTIAIKEICIKKLNFFSPIRKLDVDMMWNHDKYAYKTFNFQKFPETLPEISRNCFQEFPGNIFILAELWRDSTIQMYKKRVVYNETHLFWSRKKVFEFFILELELLTKETSHIETGFHLERGFRSQENGFVFHHFPCKYVFPCFYFSATSSVLIFPGNSWKRFPEIARNVSGNLWKYIIY